MEQIFANIGRSVVFCQKIEVILGTLLFLERRHKLQNMSGALDKLAKTRLRTLEQMRQEFIDLKVQYVDYAKFDHFTDRRNWLVHRFTFESRF
jgi:hypothetical protein